MNKYDIQEAAAVVAANRRMGSRDALDIIRFALGVMSLFTFPIVIL